MTGVFATILDMSVMASWVIAVILLIRLFLRRMPKKYSYWLWTAAGFRLCCPVSWKSMFSLFQLRPAATAVNLRLADRASAVITSKPMRQVISDAAPYAAGQMTFAADRADRTVQTTKTTLLFGGTAIWIIGVALLLAYSIYSCIKIHRRMATAVRMRENIYQSEYIRSPFILGVFRPKIYIPFGLEGETLNYVLAHEQYHIRRRDYLIRVFAFLLLTMHWFNPLCWLAFGLMGSDMEMSCDEKVLSGFAGCEKEYGKTLLSFAAKSHLLPLSPLSFAETSVKNRIQNVLRWKQPKRRVTLAAVTLSLLTVTLCSANPKEPEQEVSVQTEREAEKEAESEAGRETQAETESEAGRETQAETESEAGRKTQTEAESQAIRETQAEAENGIAREIQTETESDTGRETQAETESDTGRETQAETESDTGRETQTEPESEAVRETQTEAESEAIRETQAEAENKIESNFLQGRGTEKTIGEQMEKAGSSSGQSGSMIWELLDGTLTIHGSGAMEDYDLYTPWKGNEDNISAVAVEPGVTGIGSYAFSLCTELAEITLPEGVTSIGNEAFDGCISLMEIQLPDSLTSIGYSAFGFCASLKEVTIPAKVTELDGTAFWYCSSLETIRVEEDNANYSSEDGVLYDKTKTKLIAYPMGKRGELQIAKSVKRIGSHAFEGCLGLRNLVIPEGVTDIEEHAFEGSQELLKLELPDSMSYIGEYAFAYCDHLTMATIPASVTEIAENAFEGCELLTLLVPSGSYAERYAKSQGLAYVTSAAFAK